MLRFNRWIAGCLRNISSERKKFEKVMEEGMAGVRKLGTDIEQLKLAMVQGILPHTEGFSYSPPLPQSFMDQNQSPTECRDSPAGLQSTILGDFSKDQI